MKTCEIAIESLAYGGAGIGRHEGKVCFVPFTAPGDRVRARIVREKKGYMEGELAEILTPSTDRVTPTCPLFGQCGGCSWQHLGYSSQLAAKEAILRSFMQRVDASAQSLPIIPSPRPFGYRSRIQLKVRNTDNGLVMGFYRKGSHYVVDLPDKCPLASAEINAFMPGLRQILSAFPERNRIPQVDMAHGDDGRVHLTFHALDETGVALAHHLLRNCDLFPQQPGGIHIQSGRKENLHTVSGSNELSSSLPGGGDRSLTLSYTVDGFSQVNHGVNTLLIQELAVLAGQLQDKRLLLDLCCGNGNLSLPLAPLFERLIGIEGYPPSIESARKNASVNGIRNAHFQVGAAERFPEFLPGRNDISLVILDPPREGAKDAIGQVASARIPWVFYVSCDPSTLARDAAILCRAGYRLVSFRGFDMFPQTYHIETLATFELQH